MHGSREKDILSYNVQNNMLFDFYEFYKFCMVIVHDILSKVKLFLIKYGNIWGSVRYDKLYAYVK